MNFLSELFPKQAIADTFFLLAGPCVVESRDNAFLIAQELKNICTELEIPLIFKASYKKANRSSLNSFTGLGDDKALEILKEIKEELKLPIVTDIHSENEIDAAAAVVDVLQIPAFLCRQTELLQAAGKSGKIINIKKGQFLHASAMQWAVEKVRSTGNEKMMLTERGTTFGYEDLLVDFKSIPIMKKNKVPVVMDCTHSLQKPNQPSGITGGMPEYIELMAKCGIVSGAHGLFIETHPNPAKALSDGANMLILSELKNILIRLKKLKAAL